jgi:tetratricopeptide (TPR) repeat protein
MASLNLSRAVAHYSETLKSLETAQERPSEGQVLAVLKARDTIHAVLSDSAPQSVDDLLQLAQLDKRLKGQSGRIAQAVDLADLRSSFQPPTQAWWWFIQGPSNRWERFDWMWGALTVLCLTISLGLVVDISSRFLAGGPDTLASLAIVGQSVLTLLAAGGALTVAGQEVVKRTLASLKIPVHFWHESRFALAILLLGGVFLLRSYLPFIAIWYNNHGLQNYNAGLLTSAQFDYQRAIKLNPDYVAAHYNLGLLYEDLQQVDQARAEYLAAVKGGLDAAHNNLARLYILDENYTAAVPLLTKGLSITQDDAVKYDLHKNLGWARLGQARYEEAVVELRSAIALAPDQAPAHCLLAQVLENRGDEAGAREEWEICLKLADPLRPDEDAWIGLARQRLGDEGK